MAQDVTSAAPRYKFHDPIMCELNVPGKHYHLQKLTSDSDDVFITTDWFRSDGIKSAFGNKSEIFFKVSGTVRDILNVIEHEAVVQMKIPVEVIQRHNIQPDTALQSLYRNLNSSDFLFGKLQRDCIIFNARRQVIRKEDTGFGDYRVLLHVKGLYIGPHAQEGKLLSLHMRIIQVQYREVSMACLLDPFPGLTRNPTLAALNSVPVPIATSTPVSVKPPVCPGAPVKKPRGRQGKLALQRQNAVMETTSTTDIFADLDI